MIRTADQRSGSHVVKTHVLSCVLVLGKLLGLDKPYHPVVLVGGSQVLTDGQDIASDAPEVGHQFDNLVPGLAESHHKAGLGTQGGVACPGLSQNLKRPLIVCLWPNPGVQPGHRLHVVVENASGVSVTISNADSEPPKSGTRASTTMSGSYS